MSPSSAAARRSQPGGQLRIGISGWRYAPWRGKFYPPGLAQRQELAFASRMLGSIELNGSFYSLQRPASWQAWHDETPEDFMFAVKGPRYVTHLRRLKDVRVPVANFFASGLLALGRKLGPLLWQFPPQMAFDAERFEAFFELLPRDTEAALALAREHDARLAGRSWLQVAHAQKLRHAVEIRDESFATPEFIALLRRHRMALVVADTAGHFPLLEDLSADFVYVRLHGDAELYASGYGDAALDRWADRITHWSHGEQVADARLASSVPAPRRVRRDVFCYFDNDVKVHAPFDAARLARRLGVAHGLDAVGHFTPPPALLLHGHSPPAAPPETPGTGP
ncbi:MAG TPA: DUF72 domain-containing protein [Ideonella sp.]|uniref:DUF72 domain-containing protein n=1 Tax=Ideonella sp. TaxID=1929293 RepID=UPI002BFDBD6E|nr:DUF72 domain-containing protein [Ideonella sp.]HSI50290.1 DUF72 domain-containing protein [Ideonella sp.]